MVQAYRLVYPSHLFTPHQLWEWQQPSIERLFWNAATFGRQVELRGFRTWEALERENTRIWEHAYRPCAAYALWPTWLAWLEEYRGLLITTQEVYEAHHV
jgi:hypothetical protein